MTRWKLITDWPYLVSDTGLVRRLGKSAPMVPMMCGRKRKQYQTVRLCCAGQCIDRKVHILVLEAFVGPRPKGSQGLHRDDDTSNNELTNLYWGTPSQNAIDCAVKHGLTKEAVINILRTPIVYGSGKRLAAIYGISPQLVSDIRKGRCYGHMREQ